MSGGMQLLKSQAILKHLISTLSEKQDTKHALTHLKKKGILEIAKNRNITTYAV